MNKLQKKKLIGPKKKNKLTTVHWKMNYTIIVYCSENYSKCSISLK